MKKRTPRTNAEWSAETTAGLIRNARHEFARHGYAGASVERIAHEAGVTKGALYYHFEDKQGLFEAALLDVQLEIVKRIEARAGRAKRPVDAIVDGCLAFLDVALDDELRQIALVDAPAVLGWSRWRAIDSEHGLGSLKEGLEACRQAGHLEHLDLDAVAHLVSGALNEAVFAVAEDEDRRSARARLVPALEALVRQLCR